ncbi:MAG TPA: hypothetical protein VFL29_07505 [Candidatus Dormibacteraeota bacterium]|nr:hypothetical protein [Candidatus Dormibacteraeota bacterium]
MKPKQLFLVDGGVTVLLGIVFVVLPGLALSVLGIPPRDQARQLLVAFLGASLIANGGFQLLMRNDAGGPAGIAFMRANLVFDVIGAALSFVGLVAGIFNVVGWIFVVAFVVVGVPHGYWGFIRPPGRGS